MKKIILFISAVLMALGMQAQEYHVSKQVQKKNALVEEFTGIRCPNCPGGHRVVADLKKKYGKRVSAVAIHWGSYSINDNGPFDLTVPAGKGIADIVGGSGPFFPNGIVNRHDWDGDGRLHMTVDKLHNSVLQAFNENAPVNLWAEAVLNEGKSEMVIQVEGYYTDDIPVQPYLSLLVTQNDVHNRQDGGNMGNDYIHNHLLRDAITPVYGDSLPKGKNGTYFKKTYTYSVPKSYKKIMVNNADLELVIFVTAGSHEVQNVISIKPRRIKPLSAVIRPYKVPVKGGYRYNFVEMELQNTGNGKITSAKFDVTLNGVTAESEWKGIILEDQMAEIRIPVDWNKTAVKTNKFVVELKELNGKPVEKTSFSGSFVSPNKLPLPVWLEINTDNAAAADNTYRLCDMNGKVLQVLGPYESGKKYVETLDLKPDTQYCFELLDAKGDGIRPLSGSPAAFKDEKGNVVFSCGFVKGYGWRMFFETCQATTGIGGVVENGGDDIVPVYDITGKMVGTSRHLNELPTGVYILRSAKGSEKIFIR